MIEIGGQFWSLWIWKCCSGRIRQQPMRAPTGEGKRRRVAEDEMFGWHHRLNRHEFEPTPGDSEGLVCAVHGVAKSRTWFINWTTTVTAPIPVPWVSWVAASPDMCLLQLYHARPPWGWTPPRAMKVDLYLIALLFYSLFTLIWAHFPSPYLFLKFLTSLASPPPPSPTLFLQVLLEGSAPLPWPGSFSGTALKLPCWAGSILSSEPSFLLCFSIASFS